MYYKFFFDKETLMLDVEKNWNGTIDIVKFNDLAVIKTPVPTVLAEAMSAIYGEGFGGFCKPNEEIKSVWNDAKKRYTGLLVNGIPLHRLISPSLVNTCVSFFFVMAIAF